MQKSTWLASLDWRRFGIASLLGLASLGFGYFLLKLLKRRSAKKPKIAPPENVYETDKLVNQYMAFHYAEGEKYFKYDFGPKDHTEFPSRCADLCKKHMTVFYISTGSTGVYMV